MIKDYFLKGIRKPDSIDVIGILICIVIVGGSDFLLVKIINDSYPEYGLPFLIGLLTVITLFVLVILWRSSPLFTFKDEKDESKH